MSILTDFFVEDFVEISMEEVPQDGLPFGIQNEFKSRAISGIRFFRIDLKESFF